MMNTTKSCFELTDLMFLIGIEGRDGELVIESGNNIGSLLFHEGNILLAFSPYTKAIGDKLVEQGVLTEADLLHALKEQRSGPPMPIGAILMRSGKVEFGAIEKLVHEQIRAAINDFRSWGPAEFNFLKKSVQPVDSIRLPVYEFLSAEMKGSVRSFVKGMDGNQ